MSWKASNEGDMDALSKLYEQMLSAYGPKAKEQASQLNSFPGRDQIENYRTMNDVAVAMFIKAEALMHQGKNELALAVFNEVSSKYPWAQAWDPSRGSFWSIKEKSQASIKVMSGEDEEAAAVKAKAPKTIPKIVLPGKDRVVDYRKYGKFLNEGAKDYHYQIDDQSQLAAAVGEGIYPNITGIFKNPGYKKALQEGRLNGSHWDFVNTNDLEAAIYKWTMAQEPWGIRLFYMGIIFEKAKMYHEAIKAYQALIVHFPNTMAWTYWQTPWYPGPAAIAQIRNIIRKHPELKIEFKGAKIHVLNSFDNDSSNDVITTTPGVLREFSDEEYARLKEHPVDIKGPLGKPVKTLGKGRVRLVKYKNGHWQMLVKGRPFIIKGITYNPTKIGQSPDKGTVTNWMESDENHNGIIDAPYEAWLDKNHNNQQDSDEPSVGDFTLMKNMGVNTIRLYHHPMKIHKQFLRKMYKEHGFMVLMGDFLGKYAIGSGASWADGTDYENPAHQKKMMQTVKDMVLEFKNEPYVLMWLLGNENNYGVASNADKKPEAYYRFVNQVAKMIKVLDPHHPVAICNGDTLFLDKFAGFATDVDAYGANVYRGSYGFGSFWQQVAEAADRPAFITEYGAPAFGGAMMTYDEAKQAQAEYHEDNWLDIFYNSAGYIDGAGNAIGGVAFEWIDEWWKNYEPSRHDTKADVVGPFPGGYYYEEWFGLMGQGDGKHSPFLREPRKVYDTYQKLWKN
ncbi:MAG: tetratricopeptide repeat protein [Candidatus Omnitrophica bacterium]|nr:tetratricopeptide repeat protein [Candidatus Omnitrophota bacterium]